MIREKMVLDLEAQALKLEKQGKDLASAALMRAAALKIERLQTILDSRPAINAGLPESYINWAHGIYAAEVMHATQTPN
jgi:hypothetical protein